VTLEVPVSPQSKQSTGSITQEGERERELNCKDAVKHLAYLASQREGSKWQQRRQSIVSNLSLARDDHQEAGSRPAMSPASGQTAIGVASPTDENAGSIDVWGGSQEQ
jgi:hypothetical protein